METLNNISHIKTKPMTTLKRINLNAYLYVHLLPKGIDMYRAYYDSITFDEKLKQSTDKDGNTKFQIWEFMAIFGTHMRLGIEAFVLNNEIVFYEGDLKPLIK